MSSRERALLDAALALYRGACRLSDVELVAAARVIDVFVRAARAVDGGTDE